MAESKRDYWREFLSPTNLIAIVGFIVPTGIVGVAFTEWGAVLWQQYTGWAVLILALGLLASYWGITRLWRWFWSLRPKSFTPAEHNTLRVWWNDHNKKPCYHCGHTKWMPASQLLLLHPVGKWGKRIKVGYMVLSCARCAATVFLNAGIINMRTLTESIKITGDPYWDLGGSDPTSGPAIESPDSTSPDRVG